MLSFLFSSVITILSYSYARNLRKIGIVTSSNLEKYDTSKKYVTFVEYSFTTDQELKIDVKEKATHNIDYYKSLKIIYDPKNPNNYQEYPTNLRNTSIMRLIIGFFALLSLALVFLYVATWILKRLLTLRYLPLLFKVRNLKK